MPYKNISDRRKAGAERTRRYRQRIKNADSAYAAAVNSGDPTALAAEEARRLSETYVTANTALTALEAKLKPLTAEAREPYRAEYFALRRAFNAAADALLTYRQLRAAVV